MSQVTRVSLLRGNFAVADETMRRRWVFRGALTKKSGNDDAPVTSYMGYSRLFQITNGGNWICAVSDDGKSRPMELRQSVMKT